MNDEELLATVTVMLMLLVIRRRRHSVRWRNRRWWVRPINQRRIIQGDYHNLLQEIKFDEKMFFRYTRMDVETFNFLLRIVHPHLLKTHSRALVPEQRLFLTLRYLATGDQIISLALAFRIGESTARNVIKEVCRILALVLSPTYLRKPTEDEWRQIASRFLEDWNFPNCVGAFDGKHVLIQSPPNSGSLFFNYKKTFSIVLLAACDANYKFTLVHVGEMGSNNDAGIFMDSFIGQELNEGRLGLPRGRAPLPGSNIGTPYFFVGDDAFPLSNTMMKPYPGRGLPDNKKIFNYRLSRARRVIENAFGILSSRWRVFRKPIALYPEAVDNIILASVCLHNFLKTRDELKNPQRRLYCPPNFVDFEDENGIVHPGRWREEGGCCMENMPHVPIGFAPQNGIALRNILTDYFLTPEGEVPWQYDHIRYAPTANH